MTEQLRWEAKDPAETIDYAIDWAAVLAELGNDTIATSAWVVPAGLVRGSDGATGAARWVFLGGGVAGESHEITASITTAGGRVVVRRIRLDILPR